ncbi:hypothetical protein [Parathalassolituus penaei]|uniref:Uncharacterized protein n=1 Tax=Parathalassolituus penaei TaxID=2997323 RepID=A0A9X3EAZ9_9GAMM|nr:hypothetical protein [Parathalassolituus penaei]MCY0963915.1 hypothetical protein [Parathalassolituus penaei]
MSDWDFLHDMHNEGYSPDQIADAAACGYNPYEPFYFEELGFSADEWEELEEPELSNKRSPINSELLLVFENLVENAKLFHSLTNRYLQIWGELGELFGEINYGIKRHKPHTKGSDGKLGNDFIEIKTISPEKSVEEVRVKSAGNFNKLLIVKINEDFSFESQIIARKNLSKGGDRHLRASWKK